MYTSDENKELIKDIKTPIRTYKITAWGYGGEVVYGTSSKEEFEYWNSEQAKIDVGVEDSDHALSTYMFESSSEDASFPNVPEKFRRDGDFYEQGDIEHCSGVDLSSITIEIEETTEDANEETITINSNDIYDSDIEIEVNESDAFGHQYVFYAMSTEKGTFYEAEFEVAGKIDLSKLRIRAVELPSGDEIVCDIFYNGEILENYGMDTNGKGLVMEIQDLS